VGALRTESAHAPLRTIDEQYMPFLDAWDKTFIDVDEDPSGYAIDDIEGEIPIDLSGTLYRNGPNRFKNVDHPYDGDGFVAALEIKAGCARFRSRFVSTFGYLAESEADRVLFRSTFLTQRPRKLQNFLDLYVKNTSNTNVAYFKGRLWSLWEAGQPYHLDPCTLETIGIDDFGGTIKEGLPFDLESEMMNINMGKMVGLAQKYLSGEKEFFSRIPDSLVNAGGSAMTAHPSGRSRSIRHICVHHENGYCGYCRDTISTALYGDQVYGV
jgi:all-trans-8'-apo-beta-carotenal 15,15'-oxygenase